jgi:hypothetical protein
MVCINVNIIALTFVMAFVVNCAESSSIFPRLTFFFGNRQKENFNTSRALIYLTKRNHFKDNSFPLQRLLYREAENNMSKVIDRLQKECKVKIIKVDVACYRDRENLLQLVKHKENSNGQYPYFFNAKTAAYIRGFSSFRNLKQLALGNKHEVIDSSVYSVGLKNNKLNLLKKSFFICGQSLLEKIKYDRDILHYCAQQYKSSSFKGIDYSFLDFYKQCVNEIRPFISCM